MSETIELYGSEDTGVVYGDGSGMTLEEYFATMSEDQQAVPVRDGDDSFDVIDEDFEEGDDEPEGEETQPEEGDNLVQDFDPQSVEEASQMISQSEDGFNQMKADIVNRGVAPDELSQMEANFAANGDLTDQQWNRLAEVGYSKDFVQSYIRGQEAQATAYVTHFVNSVGGQDAFNTMVNTLKQSSPQMVGVLEQAICNRDLNTAKAIIDLAGNIRSQTYGKPAQRTVASNAVPVNTAPAVQPEGFASKQEMVAAMHDKRYLRDAAYTNEVRQKVAYSPW